tara:strand:+ start:6447 stop:6590 length:144 start_codon:yes stop_codon:yes gene_type:complete
MSRLIKERLQDGARWDESELRETPMLQVKTLEKPDEPLDRCPQCYVM